MKTIERMRQQAARARASKKKHGSRPPRIVKASEPIRPDWTYESRLIPSTLGVSEAQLNEAIATGRLKANVVGYKTFISGKALIEFIGNQPEK